MSGNGGATVCVLVTVLVVSVKVSSETASGASGMATTGVVSLTLARVSSVASVGEGGVITVESVGWCWRLSEAVSEVALVSSWYRFAGMLEAALVGEGVVVTVENIGGGAGSGVSWWCCEESEVVTQVCRRWCCGVGWPGYRRWRRVARVSR